MTDELRENANLVESLGSAAHRGGSALEDFPALLEMVIERDAWREFVTQRGDHVRHRTFDSFVRTPMLKGLGVPMETVLRIIASDPALLEKVRGLVARPPGRPPKNSVESTGFPDGGDRAANKLERLSREHPDERASVARGEKSINRAAIDAGIRPKRVSIRVDSAESIAATLRRQVAPEVLAELARLLAAERGAQGD